MDGWYIMQRGWMDSFRPEPFTEREAFLWSIEQAGTEDGDQWFGSHSVQVERGEFATSIRHMAKTFSWTEKRVRGFMARMARDGLWRLESSRSRALPTVVRVVRFDEIMPPNKGAFQ